MKTIMMIFALALLGRASPASAQSNAGTYPADCPVTFSPPPPAGTPCDQVPGYAPAGGVTTGAPDAHGGGRGGTPSSGGSWSVDWSRASCVNGQERAVLSCLSGGVATAYRNCTDPRPANTRSCSSDAPAPAATTLADSDAECSASDGSDIGFSRLCYGEVEYQWARHNGAAPYVGRLSEISDITGSEWPFPGGSGSHAGDAFIVSIGRTQYLSFRFTTDAVGAAHFAADPSWGAGGTITVSKGHPGIFDKGTPGWVCGLSSGASNNLLMSNDGKDANCRLEQNETYFLNFADAYPRAPGQWTPVCRQSSCPMSYVFLEY